MKITNKKTGHTFNLSPKEAADFFYAKNARGEDINKRQAHTVETPHDISNVKFTLACLAMAALCYASVRLYFQLNY